MIGLYMVLWAKSKDEPPPELSKKALAPTNEHLAATNENMNALNTELVAIDGAKIRTGEESV